MELVSLGYRTDLALLQLAGSVVEDAGDHLVVRSPHAPTHWWGNFLLLAHVPAPDACQSWLERFAVTFPAAAHVAIGFDGTSGDVGTLGRFAERGCNADALTVMTATAILPPPRTTSNAVIRQIEGDDDWGRSVELRVRCRRPELEPREYRAFAADKARSNRRLVDAGHGAWFGAFAGGQLVAQLGLVTASPGVARFQSVETDPDHRRQGLAGSLIHHASIHGVTTLAAHTIVIVADPAYFAIDLYRALGFAPTESQLQVERKPL